jgi:hypothetical protein
MLMLGSFVNKLAFLKLKASGQSFLPLSVDIDSRDPLPILDHLKSKRIKARLFIEVRMLGSLDNKISSSKIKSFSEKVFQSL